MTGKAVSKPYWGQYQRVKNELCFRHHFSPHHQDLMWYWIQTIPSIYQNWVQGLVGLIMVLLDFYLLFWISISLYCFILLGTGYQDWLRLKPQSLLKFTGCSLLYQAVHVSILVLDLLWKSHALFQICASPQLTSLPGPGICVSSTSHIWFQLTYTLLLSPGMQYIYLWLLGLVWCLQF